MKSMIRSAATAIVFATGLSLGGAVASAATPVASPGALWSPGAIELAAPVEKVHRRRYRHYHRDRHGPRYRRRSHRHRYYYNGWWYATPWWFAPVAPRPRYRHSRHVNWCLNRYRSYNPRTDMFLAYSGRYMRCRSPYRP